MATPRFDRERLASLMERAGADLLLVSSRHNTRYLTGGYYYPLYVLDATTKRTQHLNLLAIPKSGVAEAFFVGRPGEGAIMDENDVWPELRFDSAAIGSAATVERTVKELHARRLDRGRVAVELSYLPADAFQSLALSLPNVSFVDASVILDPLRAIKRPDELELIREGLRRGMQSIDEVFKSSKGGETTAEIASNVESEYRRRELHYLYALVSAGPSLFRAPSAHRSWTTGNLLHIDSGGALDGYIVEVCRSGCMGEPSGLLVDVLAACAGLSEAALRNVRDGLPAATVQQSANDFLRSNRFGRVGNFIAHGIGMVHHEDPLVGVQETDPLRAGMVLSIETEFLMPEVGHIKVEDTVAVTHSGFDVLTPGGFAWRRPQSP